MNRHRDLEAWKTARAVVLQVLAASRTAWKPHLAAVFGQLQRSSLSVQLNIAEGYASGPGRRCRSHLRIAYASAVETDDLLEVLVSEGVLSKELGREAIDTCQRSQRLLRGLIRRYETR